MKKCPKCGVEYKDTSTLCPADGSVLKAEGSALVGRTLAGKYRVDELISEGGMGAVYRGTHILMDKTVALKVLHPALAADNVIVARFSREARAASRISHPHAISVTDFGESEDGIVFLVMEYLDGKTLKELVKSTGPLPLQRVVEIMRQICGALEAAHDENVVHRDLKSDNIMLLDVADGDWVKVLDFGIAKVQEPGGQDPGLTGPDLIVGTPQYMSPEQCSQSSEIDARSDIYSLGVIIYELLTGHVPFTGESPTSVMLKHIQEPAPDILRERGDLPPEIGKIVARTLAKNPENRFQTVRDLRLSLMSADEHSAAPLAVSDEEVRRNERIANRIIVPTKYENITDADDVDDEVTVVHPSPAGYIVSSPDAAAVRLAAQPTVWNSWKITAISLLGVIILGGIVYAMTRNRPASADQTPPLTADPNSQPVKPAAPPSGTAERGIAPTLPSDSSNLNSNLNSNTSESNQNQNSELPLDNNSNANVQQNANAPGTNNPSGSNANSNSNSNSTSDGQTPKPTPVKVDVGPPPPAASPKAKP